MAHAQQPLRDFIIDKAFNPVLQAKPDEKSDADRRALQHVQRATRDEIERYHNYGSEEEVFTNFRRDLTSSAAKTVQDDLKRLHLPTLADVREDIERKAEELGVKASS